MAFSGSVESNRKKNPSLASPLTGDSRETLAAATTSSPYRAPAPPPLPSASQRWRRPPTSKMDGAGRAAVDACTVRRGDTERWLSFEQVPAGVA